MTKSIDEWAAEQCGVDFIANRYGWFLYPVNHAITEDVHAVKWTIKDPRCREIVLDWIAEHPEYYRFLHGYINNWMAGKMKKSEAEISCITAIYEAEK